MLALCAFILGVLEFTLARRLAWKYGIRFPGEGNESMVDFLSKASMEDVDKMKHHVSAWLFMWCLASVLSFMPGGLNQ